jgi:type I restriction enzyme S subunit
MEHQQRFVVVVAPMVDEIELLEQKNTNLRAQRDLLLPKLVSGEIDVSAAGEALEAAE